MLLQPQAQPVMDRKLIEQVYQSLRCTCLCNISSSLILVPQPPKWFFGARVNSDMIPLYSASACVMSVVLLRQAEHTSQCSTADPVFAYSDMAGYRYLKSLDTLLALPLLGVKTRDANGSSVTAKSSLFTSRHQLSHCSIRPQVSRSC